MVTSKPKADWLVDATWSSFGHIKTFEQMFQIFNTEVFKCAWHIFYFLPLFTVSCMKPVIFYSIITFSYTKYFVHSYTVDVVFTLSYLKRKPSHKKQLTTAQIFSEGSYRSAETKSFHGANFTECCDTNFTETEVSSYLCGQWRKSWYHIATLNSLVSFLAKILILASMFV